MRTASMFARMVSDWPWLGPANVKREPLAQAAPRALSEEQPRGFLRAAELARPRDRAIVTLLLYTTLRLHELVALDVDDASASARKGVLVIRSGKGDANREVPLNRPCRQAHRDQAARRRDGRVLTTPRPALRRFRRIYFTRENLRAAIVEIVNKTLQARDELLTRRTHELADTTLRLRGPRSVDISLIIEH